MNTNRPPLTLTPQHFGSLIFDHRNSRYYPFDHQATRILQHVWESPFDELVDTSEEEALLRFLDAYYERGFFDVDGKLAANVLDVEVPADHLVGPLAVHLEVIAACNLTCTHCFAGQLPRHQHPLTVQEMGDLFEQLAAVGAFRLGLTGGEPLLRADIFDILDAATDAGLHPCLTTNALCITKEIAEQLGQRELIWLNVSLEGPNAETNDAVRGCGVFDAVLEKLRLLRDYARFTLAFTITSQNAHLAEACSQLAAEVGAHTAVFRPLYPVGTAQHHLDLMPSFAQYTGALSELANLPAEAEGLHSLDPFSPEVRRDTRPQIHTTHTCGAGQHVCSISVQGEVNPCSFLGNEFIGGNIRERRFVEIWNESQIFQKMRSAEAHAEFHGGCRARALTFAGSAFAADPWYEQHRQQGAMHPGCNVEVDLPPPLLPILGASARN